MNPELELLGNGAVVVAKRWVRNEYVVLAHRPGTAEPYVVWKMNSKGEITSSGSYRANIATAAALFFEMTADTICQWCGYDELTPDGEEWQNSFELVEHRKCEKCGKRSVYVYSLTEVGQGIG